MVRALVQVKPRFLFISSSPSGVLRPKVFGTLDFKLDGVHNIAVNKGLQRLICFKHDARG
jgi:hypothetical protein